MLLSTGKIAKTQLTDHTQAVLGDAVSFHSLRRYALRDAGSQSRFPWELAFPAALPIAQWH